jgi:hypothetical protein
MLLILFPMPTWPACPRPPAAAANRAGRGCALTTSLDKLAGRPWLAGYELGFGTDGGGDDDFWMLAVRPGGQQSGGLCASAGAQK